MRINEVDLNSRADLTFRFRSADKMLEYQELENTEIYFCPFEEEDDVLEGELNLYWEADEILWDNFFAHYYMVFFFHYSMMILEDENKREIPGEIYWRQFRSDYNMERPIQEFLEHEAVQDVKRLILLKPHKVNAEELLLYLKLAHFAAIETVGHVLGRQRIPRKSHLDDGWEDKVRSIDWDKTQEEGTLRVIDILFQKCREELIPEKPRGWERWLLWDFPDCYFRILRYMVFPKWYIASFCRSCNDTRNWAQYGDNHRGICLIFRTHQGAFGRGMKLKTCHGFSSSQGRIIEDHIEPLKEVKYTSDAPEINFFEMLGGIPGKMAEEWYHGRDGSASQYCVDESKPEWSDWHHRYWQAFEALVSHKGADWHDLAEERIVLETSLFENYEQVENRKIKYGFEELEGIIWGCATTDENKKRIREIIGKLCAEYGREEFPFYQAVKNPAKRGIGIERAW